MTLKSEILQNFFNNSKNPDQPDVKPKGSAEYSYFRVFDSPSEKKPESEETKKWSQSEAKVESNWSQSGAKLEPNRSQSRAEVEPNRDKNDALSIKVEPNWSQSGAVTRATTGAKVEPNWSQSGAEQAPKLSFMSLVGLQRKIVFLIYEQSQLSRNKITDCLSIEFLVTACKTTKSALKKALQRLEKKELIKRYEYKTGRGGWTKYEIPDLVFNQIMQIETNSKLESKWSQSGAKVEPQLEPQLEPSPPSSSSSNYNNKITTTTGNPADYFLNTEWAYIDFSPLVEIGFGEAHVKQLAKSEKITPEDVQDSIYAFAYALTQPDIRKSIKSNPLTYFMGILIKKGEPYLPPVGYESPKELALKAEIERKKQKLDLEKELKRLKFEEWYNALLKEEKNNLLEQELSDELKEKFFLDGKAKYIPESVKENQRRQVLEPYFFNNILN